MNPGSCALVCGTLFRSSASSCCARATVLYEISGFLRGDHGSAYRLYISHPVTAPMIPPPMMLAQLMAFVLASIFSPLFAIAASLDPMNMCIINLGVTIAVASAYICGCTVGNVDIAPLEIE